jgi:hypothetical protein
MQGQPCYDPDTVDAHATYAFNAYYHGMGMGSGTCYFSGVAVVTTTDPSKITHAYHHLTLAICACIVGSMTGCLGCFFLQVTDLVFMLGRTGRR